jgi:two-component sensor histidine kinase
MNPSDPDTQDSKDAETSGKTFRQSLVVRIAFLLTLALLPIGLVAMGQSWRALHITNNNLEASIHARTSALVTPERSALDSKIGTANALADAVGVLDLSSEQCTRMMQRTAETNPRLAFAAFVERGSVSRCNSFGREIDFDPDPRAQELFDDPQPYFAFRQRGAASQRPVIIVAYPSYGSDGQLRGYVSISFEAQPLLGSGEPDTENLDVALVTFNKFGDVLASYTPEGSIDQYLPAGLSLQGFAHQDDSFFTATTLAGDTRLISVVPILPGEVYAIGSWGQEELRRTTSPWFVVSTLLFPFLMWLVGIIVAVTALNRLVLRHIRDLGRRMRRFATHRNVERADNIEDAPSEIQTINGTFETMADKLLRDEADLENALFEREVLLKEVHHRVKNNLQLISSIINMQVRQVASPEAVPALRQFQDRVTSLASVHRALYQEPSLTHIRFDVLLKDLVAQAEAGGTPDGTPVETDLDLDQVTLLPDQTGPLAMVTTEALSNAFKFGGPGPDGVFQLKVVLKESVKDGKTSVRLTIENSVDAREESTVGKGLGKRLIVAFSSQLDGELDEIDEPNRHGLSLTFEYQPFMPD